MGLRFDKMHGAGNDFVMLDLRGGAEPPSRAVTQKLGDRHFGVGCDQIISIEDPVEPGTIASYRIWNSDGSVAGQCGNGARCVAAWVEREMQPPAGEPFVLSSPAGLHQVVPLGDGHYQVAMGVPSFDPRKVPLSAEIEHEAVTYPFKDFEFSAVSMGNPHAVIVVREVFMADVTEVGDMLQMSSLFPESVNVGFAQVVSRTELYLRVYERGAGETLACGSGACAAVAALVRRGMLDRKVTVTLPGGRLQIEWPADDQPVLMSGPTAFVFQGELTV